MTVRFFGPYNIGPTVGDDEAATASVTTDLVCGKIVAVTYIWTSVSEDAGLTIETVGSSGSLPSYTVATLMSTSEAVKQRIVAVPYPTIYGGVQTFYTDTQEVDYGVGFTGVFVWDKLTLEIGNANAGETAIVGLWVED